MTKREARWSTTFHNGDKMPGTIKLKSRELCCGSWFQVLPSMIAWPSCIGPVTAQSILGD